MTEEKKTETIEIEEFKETTEVRPDNELKIDESKLSKEDLEEYKKSQIPLWLIIAVGTIIVLMVACIIVITSIK